MYGRARRIALAWTIAIIAAVVIVLYFIISSLFTNTAYQEENMNFEYLRDYFLGKANTVVRNDKINFHIISMLFFVIVCIEIKLIYYIN